MSISAVASYLSPSTIKFNTKNSTRKIMFSVLWDRKGVCYIIFGKRWRNQCCKLLRDLEETFQSYKRNVVKCWQQGSGLLYDDTHPHKAHALQSCYFIWFFFWSMYDFSWTGQFLLNPISPVRKCPIFSQFSRILWKKKIDSVFITVFCFIDLEFAV